MKQFILLGILIVLGILGGFGIAKYSSYCEIKYNMCDKVFNSKKRTITLIIINLILMLLCFFKFHDNFILALIIALFSNVLTYMIVIDFETMYILDRTHLAILALAVLSIILFNFGYGYKSITESLFGLLLGGGSFLLIALIANPMAKRKYGDDVLALGYGDVKLMAVCGLFLGWKLIIVTIILACIVGLLAQVVIKLALKNKEINFAFGPYLAIGMILAIYLGEPLINLYLNVLGL